MLAKNEGSARVETSERNKVETLVHGIVGSNDSHEPAQRDKPLQTQALNNKKAAYLTTFS